MAEGILEPRESAKLNFNQQRVQSPLLHRLWASAVLCCVAGQCPTQIWISASSFCTPIKPWLQRDRPEAVSCPCAGGPGTSCPPALPHLHVLPPCGAHRVGSSSCRAGRAGSGSERLLVAVS